LSKKINCFCVIDFETGGFEHDKNPIVEFAALGINGITLEEVLRYDNVVKPYDSKLVVELKAVQVHGITSEIANRDGVPLSQLVNDICQVATETNVFESKICRPILVGHNPTFDIPFLEDAFDRAGVDISQYFATYKSKHNPRSLEYLDTMVMAKMADAHIDKLKYSLGEVSSRHGNGVVDGHRALNDVIATADVFRHFIAKLRSSGGMVQASDGSGQVRKQFQI
jgi:DNA polymerase III epsilon subunit-like protein